MLIHTFPSFEELDKKKFQQLILSGFGRALTNDYFEYCKPKLICIATEQQRYCGAIVMEQVPGTDICYLDKLVVHKDFKGKGIGKALWQKLNKFAKKVVWRAKKENPFNRFYEKHAQDVLRHPELPGYHIFCYGLSQRELQKALPYVAQKRQTLQSH